MSRKITHEKLLDIRKELKSLPKAVRIKVYNGLEALNELKGDIFALINKGYNPKEIAKILKEAGLPVSVAKVKNILELEPLPCDARKSILITTNIKDKSRINETIEHYVRKRAF